VVLNVPVFITTPAIQSVVRGGGTVAASPRCNYLLGFYAALANSLGFEESSRPPTLTLICLGAWASAFLASLDLQHALGVVGRSLCPGSTELGRVKERGEAFRIAASTRTEVLLFLFLLDLALAVNG